MDSPTATDCNAARRAAQPRTAFARGVEADFTGGALTADGGALLMGLANQSVGLFRRVGLLLRPPRRRLRCTRWRRWWVSASSA